MIYRAFRSFWHGVFGLLFLLMAGLTPVPAVASDVPGANDPAFVEALEHWLDDDEEAAIRALSERARADNRAAQILLGLIDKSPALQGPWLAHLPRDDRIALLRAPGGMSGRRWLNAAADHPLAENWLALLSVEAGLSVVEEFRDMGEDRAAREALVALAAREHADLRSAAPEALDPELLYLAWRNAGDERRSELLSHVPEAHPQRAMMGEGQDESALQDWLENAPAAAPLRVLCTARCGATRDTCLSGAYDALSSHNALLIMGSPAESLVSQEAFLESPRGQAAVLRRILQSNDARGRGAMIAQMQDRDACLAEVLSEEQARYHYHRPGIEDGAPVTAD
ncbi:MAG: hypothetical protein HLUCCA12_03245 [Rhodobacteraceae bacterium HLUCCA12]|nr:MAG: hypothetical protein HLUCCA12_03245 [Rhodobacteraceae bacterium HLUCCA12]